MSENVGASTTRNPKGLHGLYRDKKNVNFASYRFKLGSLALKEDRRLKRKCSIKYLYPMKRNMYMQNVM
jgi:hypothetical protein